MHYRESIQHKLIQIILTVTLVSLVLGFSIVIITTVTGYKKDMVNSTVITAGLISEYCVSPISFNDKDGLTDILSKIASMPSITGAVVLDTELQEIASVKKERMSKISFKNNMNNGYYFKQGTLHVFDPIQYQNTVFGVLYIQASTEELNKKIVFFTLTMIMLLILLVLLAYTLARKMQKLISEPITKLATITEKISQDGDYSLRVSKIGNDEIGRLYDEFNIMLEQIERRNTDLDTAKDQLETTKNYLSNIINTINSALITIDKDLKIMLWNKEAEKFMGFIPDVGTTAVFDVVPYLRKYEDQLVRSLTYAEIEAMHREVIMVDNNKIFINITFFPFVFLNKHGVVIRFEDITDFEKKDEQLRQAQKMETIGNLAGGLAHDFNNVLGGIIGTVSLMKYEISIKKLSPESMDAHIQVIDEAAHRAADMVMQLLTLSRKHELTFAVIDLNKSIEHVMKVCANSFDKSIEYEVHYNKKPAYTKADHTQVEQMLLNLCVNAAHAMTIMRKDKEKQGGTLGIQLTKLFADKHYCATHPEARSVYYWQIQVRDTGVGIEPILLTKIFDPFFTTKDKLNGSGLGLSMVYTIIKQHRGFIDVYSELNTGTTINVLLPVEDDNVLDPSLLKAELMIVRGSGTVLIIDDEALIRNTAQKILEECGYKVLTAENGIDGLQLFTTPGIHIDGVLLDMAMPHMSGRDVFIKMKEIDPTVPVILASGFKQDDRVQEVLSLGVKDFIQKPYTMYELSKKIKEIIDAKNE